MRRFGDATYDIWETIPLQRNCKKMVNFACARLFFGAIFAVITFSNNTIFSLIARF
jgi:hypothetical protein